MALQLQKNSTSLFTKNYRSFSLAQFRSENRRSVFQKHLLTFVSTNCRSLISLSFHRSKPRAADVAQSKQTTVGASSDAS